MSNLNNVIAWSLVLKTIIFKEILLHRLLIFLLNYYSKYKLIFLLSNFLIFGFAFPTFRSLYSPGSLRCLVFGNLLGMLNEIQIRNTTDTWGRLESTAVETSWKKKKKTCLRILPYKVRSINKSVALRVSHFSGFN